MLQIYNSISRKKEEFKPNKANEVTIYVCGPTVYDFAHVGNGRTYAAFDVIIRYLRWQGFKVTYVRNITDIDDKIIKRANENNESFEAVVERYTNAIHEDFAKLGLIEPDNEPKATEYIPQIVNFIEKLIENGSAYVAKNGDVNFDVRSFENYGKLSNRNIDELESGARVEVNTHKKDPLDFVLWKLAKPNEPKWDSPWGEGRPGWHIECSVMSTSLLGLNIDIHGGGKDLIFPHHENEVAQSEACTHKKFVNYWLHSGFLQIDKEKMSKSLGNFFTIRDVLNNYPAEVVRYFMISGHYRSSVNYSKNALKLARQALERLYGTLRGLDLKESIKDTKFEKEFVSAMNDDFNTPIAISILFELSHEVQRLKSTDLTLAAKHAVLLKELGGVFGILQDDPQKFLQSGAENLDAAKIEKLINDRAKARLNKDFSAADRIRDELIEMSVELEDGADGTSWKYINK